MYSVFVKGGIVRLCDIKMEVVNLGGFKRGKDVNE